MRKLIPNYILCSLPSTSQAESENAQAAVKEQKERLNAQNKEINAMAARKEKINKTSDEAQLEIKQLDHKLAKLKSEAKDSENKVRGEVGIFLTLPVPECNGYHLEMH